MIMLLQIFPSDSEFIPEGCLPEGQKTQKSVSNVLNKLLH